VTKSPNYEAGDYKKITKNLTACK